MDIFQVRGALREVRAMRQAVFEKQRLRGFSGRARASGGGVALVAGFAVWRWPEPLSEATVFGLWGAVFVLSWAINYGSVLAWSARRARSGEPRAWRPHLETLPFWVAGGLATLALWWRGDTALLYGVWMLLFGLMQTTNRSLLPRELVWVGAYYILAGGACLFAGRDFIALAPVMGAVFFLGELMGGVVFHFDGDWSRLQESRRESAGWEADA